MLPLTLWVPEVCGSVNNRHVRATVHVVKQARIRFLGLVACCLHVLLVSICIDLMICYLTYKTTTHVLNCNFHNAEFSGLFSCGMRLAVNVKVQRGQSGIEVNRPSISWPVPAVLPFKCSACILRWIPENSASGKATSSEWREKA